MYASNKERTSFTSIPPRIAALYDIPIATNIATADYFFIPISSANKVYTGKSP